MAFKVVGGSRGGILVREDKARLKSHTAVGRRRPLRLKLAACPVARCCRHWHRSGRSVHLRYEFISSYINISYNSYMMLCYVVFI